MRARELLPYISRVESVVYRQCERDAKSTVALAKCAVRVFDSRDQAALKEEEAKKRNAKPILTVVAHHKSNHDWMYNSSSNPKRHSLEKMNHSTYRLTNNANRSPVVPRTNKKRLNLKQLAKPKAKPRFRSLKLPLINRFSENGKKFSRLLESGDKKRRTRRKIDDGMRRYSLIIYFLPKSSLALYTTAALAYLKIYRVILTIGHY
ncbi:unnamed protein product [Angiostrongylus costaricensis]|uniref:POP1 domain-containing protein n=1 Tax=Angiostrongylus costaricensis TaxID=334426 RepID=A0A0R3Q0Z9_ANGCS|nr:unnamed protein product [Angiostrongylus costaricensis]